MRVCDEITPMGRSGYRISESPSGASSSAPTPHATRIQYLSPAAWHAAISAPSPAVRPVLVDLRNHYESRIGYFDGSDAGPALRPPIRRFSQWPLFVRRHLAATGAADAADGGLAAAGKGRTYLTYCTGGIRCEKGARWLAENAGGGEVRVATLGGGIGAYQSWMEGEIRAGRKIPSESLFRGRNYVFDARGSTGLRGEEGGQMASCHGCGRKEDRLGKCVTRRCHLIMVVCVMCEDEEGGLRCCEECREAEDTDGKTRPMCRCEREREERLWGHDT